MENKIIRITVVNRIILLGKYSWKETKYIDFRRNYSFVASNLIDSTQSPPGICRLLAKIVRQFSNSKLKRKNFFTCFGIQ